MKLLNRAASYVAEKAKRVGTAAALGVSMLVGVIGAAHAELPASVTTTVTGIQTDGQSIFDLVFPVVGVFVGLGVMIKLFKRFTRAV